MKENQITEWKESWRDEYLKWICGYANAQGGTLFIGKDDNGIPVGLVNPHQLIETIPNKIRNSMGIIADVNMRRQQDKDYVAITVGAYPFPVSYRGKYYFRSGATLQLLTGAALDQFILKKQGLTWDAAPISCGTADILKKEALNIFREEAMQSGRLAQKALKVSDELLLRNLGMYEDDFLKRAAVMVFHSDPEKWVQGAYIKIGFFGISDSDLIFQDEVHGPLIEQFEKTMELIYQKYMKSLITYNDVYRVETPMFPRDAFREILLNAIIHRDYSIGIPIQISVYENKLYVWNPGDLPQELSPKKLFEKHASYPRNPNIAEAFFKAGLIESWGRGFDKIKEVCQRQSTPLPNWRLETGGVMVQCKESNTYKEIRDSMILREAGGAFYRFA